MTGQNAFNAVSLHIVGAMEPDLTRQKQPETATKNKLFYAQEPCHVIGGQWLKKANVRFKRRAVTCTIEARGGTTASISLSKLHNPYLALVTAVFSLSRNLTVLWYTD